MVACEGREGGDEPGLLSQCSVGRSGDKISDHSPKVIIRKGQVKGDEKS